MTWPEGKWMLPPNSAPEIRAFCRMYVLFYGDLNHGSDTSKENTSNIRNVGL